MKSYELTVLIHPDLEMNLEPATNKIKSIIEAQKGKITNSSNDGKKRLAYKIADQEFAIYYSYDVELPPEAPAKISNSLSLADEVIRYLLVTVDPHKAKMLAKEKERIAKQDAKENNEVVAKATKETQEDK